ncbi:hypothetical protein JoomaDRAFT_1550 [Galbibacter orientalis DSM 19592]|uniref:Carboxypeptidase-like regulatory domain-containing protein n=1 Tax=Galbibacter orientalis DSM 19592 TaxID=926559 RepID=I3C4M1_9FLAO|nr:DUF5686 and carboxypeptidase-like regulatory domain-containing protein [Galbibacter orientalis]EIJ38564.1 hypothetical protein JoomaDRAFT_1550 [Galbibacter orientalis DSM 19592]
MKNLASYILVFFLLLVKSNFAQDVIHGSIQDKETKTPLPFATIVAKENNTVSNLDGKFSIEIANNNQKLLVSYVGYKPKEVTELNDNLVIQLEKNIEKLDEVVLQQQKVNNANTIIKKAIVNRQKNNPEDVLNTFNYRSYSKLIITADKDSINGTIDSIFRVKKKGLKFKKIDSTNYQLKKQLEKSHLYILEKASNFLFSKHRGKRETILGTHMAGLSKPIYEVLALEMQSFSFYKNHYIVFGTEFVSPLGESALKTYNYKILDTVVEQNREGYLVHYYPKEDKEKIALEGVLYIDRESYALQKTISQLNASIDVQAVQNYTYFPKENIWFPTNNKVVVGKGDNNNVVNLFGTLRIASSSKMEDSTFVSTNPDDITKHIYLTSETNNFEIRLNSPVTIERRGTAIELVDVASERDEEFWKTYRTKPISEKEKETYTAVDSLVAANNYEKKLSFIRKAAVGYVSTKYIDFDYKSLLKFNRYEGFRIGMSAVTNNNFSNKYKIHGYGAYGTKDGNFKYGFGAERRLDKYDDTRIGINYKDDLVETGSLTFITDGRAFYLFEPRLFNLSQFHKVNDISTYMTHDFTPKLSSKLQLSHQDVKPTYEYTFTNDGKTYESYQTSSITASIQWNPFNKYMQTNTGKVVIENNYPQFTIQTTQALRNIFDSDLSFSKISMRVMHEISPLNMGKTTFLFVGGIGFGDLPITELYNTSPNQPDGEHILNRFSVAGRDSFETMYFNEFFSDRYAVAQAKHYFKRFNITDKFRPELVLISRFAIGNISERQQHEGIEFSSLENGYLESGLEVNKILKGFGLNFMYRYGAYHLPNFDDNISFKFTYYFTLGF